MKTVSNFPRLSFALLSLCVLTFGASPARAQRTARKAAPPPPVVAAQPVALPARPVVDKLAPAGWTRYEVGQPTRFSLLLPAEPSGSAERISLTPKVAVTVRNYMSLGESGLYGATYMEDLPADVMNEAMKRTIFEAFVKGFAEGFQAQMNKGGAPGEMKMLEQRAATAGGLNGYEQEFAFDKMTGRVRLVYDGARAYAVLSFWSDPAKEADRTLFFESLRVKRGR
ncbi:MAG: hypothetical protein QOD32_3455 [Pyrinomonadaceae bacterium]|jgi:hypothetical protein|nr:hypothetical protein [Pyrinomonadaceae bacterium]